MHDEHLPVKEATIKAMDEVTGPVVAIVLVLCSVFVPVAFMGGFNGGYVPAVRHYHCRVRGNFRSGGFDADSRVVRAAAERYEAAHQRFFFKFDQWFAKVTNTYTGWAGFFIRRIPAAVLALLLIWGGAGRPVQNRAFQLTA